MSSSCSINAVMSSMLFAGARTISEFVLGDPAYYGRFGFTPETHVEPPFPLPAEWGGAWQSQYLDGSRVPCPGKLDVPPQWLQPALWAP